MHPLFIGLAFVGGLVAGFAIGHYVAKCKYEEITKEGFARMDAYYKRKQSSEDKQQEVASVDNVEVQTMDVEYVKPEPRDYTQYYNPENQQTDIDPAEYESPEEDEYSDGHSRSMNETYNAIHEKERNKPPRVISAAEHGTRDHEGYVSYELLYYTENDVLTVSDPEGEDIISPDELDDIVGNTLVKFGFKTNNEDVMYVRNYQRMWDLEITKVRDYYRGD